MEDCIYKEELMELAKEPKLDVQEARKQAEAEVAEEKFSSAKHSIKLKLKEIERAEKVVRNLKRELEDLYLEITG